MFNILKKNYFFCILFFLIFSIVLFCWKISFTVHKKNLESLTYEEIIKKINIKNSQNLHTAENFIIQNKNIYGTLTALFLAKKYILENNLDKAFVQLNNSLKYTKEENLKNILKVRMAKIKIQKLEYQKAINILETIKNYNWNNIVENMKGDIFMNKKNKKLAIKHWNKSLSVEDSNASKEIINMKINELKEKQKNKCKT